MNIGNFRLMRRAQKRMQELKTLPKNMRIALGASCALIAILLIILAVPKDRPTRAEALSTDTRRIAEQLLIPPVNMRPYPLVFDRRIRYTEEEAQVFRPNLGAVDISGIDYMRKAELESMYNAVK